MENNITEKYKLLIDQTKPDSWIIQLQDAAGMWAGIIFTYGKISISEPKEENDVAKLNFERDIFFVPRHLKDIDFEKEHENEFNQLIGDILVDLLNKHTDKLIDSGNNKMQFKFAF